MSVLLWGAQGWCAYVETRGPLIGKGPRGSPPTGPRSGAGLDPVQHFSLCSVFAWLTVLESRRCQELLKFAFSWGPMCCRLATILTCPKQHAFTCYSFFRDAALPLLTLDWPTYASTRGVLTRRRVDLLIFFYPFVLLFFQNIVQYFETRLGHGSMSCRPLFLLLSPIR